VQKFWEPGSNHAIFEHDCGQRWNLGERAIRKSAMLQWVFISERRDLRKDIP